MCLITGSQCCTIFSFSGLIFLLIIADLLQKEGFYIRGPTDTEAAAQACYSAGDELSILIIQHNSHIVFNICRIIVHFSSHQRLYIW